MSREPIETTLHPLRRSPLEWLVECRESCGMSVRPISFHDSHEWRFDGQVIERRLGGFFRVVGLAVTRNGQRDRTLDQPILDQPEIGVLGFLLRRDRGVPEILLQAKPEPGNVGILQAAPTVQATQSNYTRKHGGLATPYLEHFQDPAAIILADSLQSEQGGRFLNKFNRNVIVEVADAATLPVFDGYQWFAIHDLGSLLTADFLINTDARSVLASGDWSALASNGQPFARWRGRDNFGTELLRSWETPEDDSAQMTEAFVAHWRQCQSQTIMTTHRVGLHDLQGWSFTPDAIASQRPGAFQVRQYQISSAGREVQQWDQPLITCEQVGKVVLLCQSRDGVLHFLFRCRPEIGFRDLYQFGPTVQNTGDPPLSSSENDLDSELELACHNAELMLSCQHSDEGGRFYRCVMNYEIRMLEPTQSDACPRGSWMTLRQIERLVRRPGFFTNEARTLISMLLAYL